MMEKLATYLYEIGQLKRVKRSGWWMIGVKDPESVAEHTFRAALLGYVLAHLEGANPEKTAMICLFHDLAEARILDLHRTAKQYLAAERGERLAQTGQARNLPQSIGTIVLSHQEEYEEKTSLEARLAHDADLLECLIQGREYQMQGYQYAQEWINNCQKGLQSTSARELAASCLLVEPNTWWQGLNHIFPSDAK